MHTASPEWVGLHAVPSHCLTPLELHGALALHAGSLDCLDPLLLTHTHVQRPPERLVNCMAGPAPCDLLPGASRHW